ncbi:TonB-dependent receptor [Flavobacterium sp. CYK-4]|uniref:outer membrane beta-barrel family protein n=1 Tax=Flavobacterium lotistagni TaxID=2709660 RepID=UPI00140C9BFB|nr:outer membrane beta-barrel family protein [Flavobacterium lotistagni]NHM07361.1 TonB-dependent receptor [Flavobacterium lotistagni]
MKKIITLFLLVSISIVSAQQSISGTVKANETTTNSGITVLLHQTGKTSFYKSTVADAQGTFRFLNIPDGSYFVQISALGYKDFRSEVFTLSGTPVVLPQMTLKEKVNELSEVSIKGKKPMIQVLADKTVFNVQNTINSTGSSGFELLRKAPGVMIDNNDNLIVEGKTGVLIYIDGKQSYLTGADLTNFLKTIQANDIDSIEIITQPSSKYDAAGNAGIVNIKLKKNKNFGTNGTATSGTNMGKYATAINSLSLNNRNKKNNIYGNYSNRFGNNYDFINIFREQGNTLFDSKSKTKNTVNANNLKLGYDYYANAKNTFGVILTGNFNNSFSNLSTRTPIRQIGAPVNDSILSARSDSHTRTYNLYSNVNYKYADTLGTSLNIDIDYGKYVRKKDNYQPNTYLAADESTVLNRNNTFQNTPVTIDIGTFKTDYERNLFKGKLGIGVKTSLVKTDNTLDFFNENGNILVLNPNRSNQFIYKENVNAGYLNYNYTYKKINFQFGLRVENTNSDGKLNALVQSNNERVKRNYTDLFPSGGITYQLTQKHSLAMTYSRRIERPDYESLNPFEYQLDELSFMRGNPFLKPQYTDNVKLSHTYNYTLNTSISYSRVTDFFAQVIEADGPSRSFLSSRNVANQQIIDLGISYPFEVNKWWNVYLSMNAFQSKFTATNDSFISIEQETLSLYGQNNFSLPQGINLEISGWYSSPSIWGGTFRTSSIGSLDMAVQKQFWNKKFTARVAVSDIFYTSPWQGRTEYAFVKINGNGGQDSRQLRFSLSYKFGNDAVKKSRQRETGLEDEKNRIGK